MQLFTPTWGPFYGDPISCCLLIALWAYGTYRIGWVLLPALCCKVLDFIDRFFTKPDSIVGANLHIDNDHFDDIRGDCPQCLDPDASIDSNGDAMCIECGLGCDW